MTPPTRTLLFTPRTAQAMYRAGLTPAAAAAALAADPGRALGRGGRDVHAGPWRIVTKLAPDGAAEFVIAVLAAEPLQ